MYSEVNLGMKFVTEYTSKCITAVVLEMQMPSGFQSM